MNLPFFFFLCMSKFRMCNTVQHPSGLWLLLEELLLEADDLSPDSSVPAKLRRSWLAGPSARAAARLLSLLSVSCTHKAALSRAKPRNVLHALATAQEDRKDRQKPTSALICWLVLLRFFRLEGLLLLELFWDDLSPQK